jgi:UDP-2,3-diacylglucosamine hydrolase
LIPDLPGEVHAGADWRCVDLLSDQHLQAGEPATFECWRAWLEHTPADAVFLLGDLFEVWAGDDLLDAPDTGSGERDFARRCVAVLRGLSARKPVHLITGNRDFLLGPGFCERAGVTPLADPCVLQWGPRRWLLSHGDAQCSGDTDYQHFRALVRSPQWQADFLARPLAEREQIAHGLRQGSEQRKRMGMAWSDLDADTVRAQLREAGAPTLIHGHTHRPATHDLGHGLSRQVLSDWDAAGQPPRDQVLRLWANGDMERLHAC